jgi:hypothetical protein
MAYSFSTAHASNTGAVASTQRTRLELTAIINPLGKVHITPAPIVAGQVTLLKKLAGTPGTVDAHATQAVVFPTGSPASSAINVCGEVGDNPIEDGLPNPMVAATAVT